MIYSAKTRRIFHCVLAAGASLFPPGCGPEIKTVDSGHEQHLRRLAILYGRHIGAHRGKAPAGPDEFKKFIKGLDAFTAESLKVDAANVDGMFVSPRDQQPYAVVYKVAAAPAADGSAPVIMYERQGANGKRLVAYANAKVEDVDEAKLKQLVPGS